MWPFSNKSASEPAANSGPPVRTFVTFEDYHAFDTGLASARRVIEAWIIQHEKIPILCGGCRQAVEAQVHTGALFGSEPNLREGLLCPSCGLTNRNRLMAVLASWLAPPETHQRVAVFENESALTSALTRLGHEVSISRFVPEKKDPLHQDMTATTYPKNSFDLVMHNDVLEHVPDYKAALRDNFRILAKGGILLFTTPLVAIRNTIVRATLDESGEITHHLPPEIHGDPLNNEGVLAFYNFGFDLVEAVRDAGFKEACLMVSYDPAGGLTTNNHPDTNEADGSRFGNMLPCAIVARKA